MSSFVNIAAYKFVDLDDLDVLKAELLPLCKSLDLKGTILLSSEGINLFLAGSRDGIDSFLASLRSKSQFDDLEVKESLSDHQPFSRMLVRLKKEIIAMGHEEIRPRLRTSPKLAAKELKKWLDEGRDITLLDVRNDYEVEIGTFVDAVPIGVDSFREFPNATESLPEDLKSKPIVMFCTGGIRCEKAGPLMENQGFGEIYQLDGGILKYFEECGGDYYDGDCFVFDKRVALDPQLNETEYEQCYSCQSILTTEEQASEHYEPPYCCPRCYETPAAQMKKRMSNRQQSLQDLITPLPGSIPYNNIRPVNVPLKFDQQPLIDFLSQMHATLTREYWVQECEAERVTYKEQVLTPDTIVRSGWRIHHLVPQTTEPDVSSNVSFLYEDDAIIAVNKPAPLPMHPCGRFNRNTLKYFMRLAFPGEQIRILHRLDANTTGVVLMARKKWAATQVQLQFEQGTVEKTYLAKVFGDPSGDQFRCEAPISAGPVSESGVRAVDKNGLEAITDFQVIERMGDGTALIQCTPITGRTNQIRLHLQSLGLPIVGDTTYGKQNSQTSGGQNNRGQTKGVLDPPMCLHAWRLQLKLPNQDDLVEIKAPIPQWGEFIGR